MSAVFVTVVCTEHDNSNGWDSWKVHWNGSQFDASQSKLLSQSMHRRRHQHKIHSNVSHVRTGAIASANDYAPPQKLTHHQSNDEAVLHRIPVRHQLHAQRVRANDAGARHSDRFEASKSTHRPQHQPHGHHHSHHHFGVEPTRHQQHTNNAHHSAHHRGSYFEAHHEPTTQEPFRSMPPPTPSRAKFFGGRWNGGRHLATATTTTTLSPVVSQLNRFNGNALHEISRNSPEIDESDDDYFDDVGNNAIDDDDDPDDDDELYDDDDEVDNEINEVGVANDDRREDQSSRENERSRSKVDKTTSVAKDETVNHDYQSDLPYFDSSFDDEDNGQYLSALGYQGDEPIRNSRLHPVNSARATANGIHSVSLSFFSSK